MITLDLVIATYNRPELLALTLNSVAQASIPSDLAVRILVADNNSTPDKQGANRAAIAKYAELDIVYLFESRQGKSWALNTAIMQCQAAYVAFIDDDEQLDARWFETATAYLREARVDYFGGPCKPDWAAKPPPWLPVYVGKYRAVLGWIEQNDSALPFDEFGGGLCGGNCVIRRSALLEVGGFSTMIGRSANNLLCGEDDELHRKLRAQGKIGMYDPELVIYHFIPVHRMTRKYHLRWAFWSGVSNGVRLNWLPAEQVAKLFGLPRYRFSLGLYGLLLWLRKLLSKSDKASAEGFSGLMDAIYLIGAFYGKHFFCATNQASKN